MKANFETLLIPGKAFFCIYWQGLESIRPVRQRLLLRTMKRCTHESCGVVVIRKNSAADMEAFLLRKSYRGFRGFLEIPIRTKYTKDSYKRVALRELEERIRLDVNTNICERDLLFVRTEEYACVGYDHRIHIFTLLLPEWMPECQLRNSMSCEWIRSADLTSRYHHIQCNHANIVKTAFALVRKQKPEEKNIRIFQAADMSNLSTDSSTLKNGSEASMREAFGILELVCKTRINESSSDCSLPVTGSECNHTNIVDLKNKTAVPEALEESSSDCSPTAAANNGTQVLCVCSSPATANNDTQVLCSQSERMPELNVTENCVSPVDASDTWELYKDPISHNLWWWNPRTEAAFWVHDKIVTL